MRPARHSQDPRSVVGRRELATPRCIAIIRKKAMFTVRQHESIFPRTARSAHNGLLLEFASRQRLRTYRPRQVILHQSDRTDHVLVVLNGWAEQVLQFPNGKRQILSLALAGDLCTTSLSAHSRMDHSIAAITPLTVSIIGKFEFRTLLTSHPRLARSFWKNLLLSLSIQRRWTANLGQLGAMERVAHLMCELHLRQEKMGLAAGNICGFPLTQTQIAEACGLTQVHTNRVIQELRRRDVIDLRNKRLVVKSPDKLREMALFDPAYLDLAELDASFCGPVAHA